MTIPKTIAILAELVSVQNVKIRSQHQIKE